MRLLTRPAWALLQDHPQHDPDGECRGGHQHGSGQRALGPTLREAGGRREPAGIVGPNGQNRGGRTGEREGRLRIGSERRLRPGNELVVDLDRCRRCGDVLSTGACGGGWLRPGPDQALEGVGRLGRRREPLVRLVGQQLVEHPDEAGGQIRQMTR